MNVPLPLTEKQERVWRYIRSCKRSPTYAEMQRDLGYNSRGELHKCVQALRRKGFIAGAEYGAARSLVPLEPKADLAIFPTDALAAELARRRGA